MNHLDGLNNQKVSRVDIVYDHVTINFFGGDCLTINNKFHINFYGLYQLLNRTLLSNSRNEKEIILRFEEEKNLFIVMTDDGYNCPEALELYLKEKDFRMIWD